MDNEKGMSDFLEEARDILFEIKTHQKVNEKQLETYKEMMDNSISLNRERIDLADKRLNGMRGLLIFLAGLFMLSFISDKVILINRPTAEEIESEYLSTDKALRGFGVVVDDYYDIHEELTKDEIEAKSDKAKQNILKEIDPNYRTRSAKTK